MQRHAILFVLTAGLACSGPDDAGTRPALRDANGEGEVSVWVTTGDRSRLLDRGPDLSFVAESPDAPFMLQVDEQQSFQTMVGFGAAITDASAWLIQTQLAEAQRDSLLSALFDRVAGIGLSFTRITIGASDFSLRHYTYDDMPRGQTDPRLAQFSIDPAREAVLPVTKSALEINPELRVMATPWSAPGWMKTTDSMIKGRLRPDAYEPFANYLLAVLEAFSDEGVPIHSISVQNEPHYEPDDYPGMRMEAEERARFIGEYLGPLLERSGFDDTLILDWDHNWDDFDSPLQVLSDSAARQYIDGVAWHCYAGDVSTQSLVRDAYPDKEVFFTECSGGEWAPDFADNLQWNVRNLIIGATRHWSRGTLMWNLALDPNHGPHAGGCGNCRGVVTIDPATGDWTPNEEYYALAHASKFVRPGARRVESTSGVGGLESVAFRNPDGSKAMIVLNTAAEERDFGVDSGDGWFSYSLPAGAVATFGWR